MTDLKRPVKRKTRIAPIHGVREEIVVTLYPGGSIGLREARCRREYALSIGAVYQMAVRAQIQRDKLIKKATKNKARYAQ